MVSQLVDTILLLAILLNTSTVKFDFLKHSASPICLQVIRLNMAAQVDRRVVMWGGEIVDPAAGTKHEPHLNSGRHISAIRTKTTAARLLFESKFELAKRQRSVREELLRENFAKWSKPQTYTGKGKTEQLPFESISEKKQEELEHIIQVTVQV